MNKQMKKNSVSTRKAILAELKINGAEDAETLGHKFGLTAMAVRQHLYALEAEGDVEHVAVKQPVGRPKKKWALTEQANIHFANSHATLAVELIDIVKRTFGEDGLDKLVQARAADQIKFYSDKVGKAEMLSDKLAMLAQIRSEEGYMAAVCEADKAEAYLFVENHCPVCEAAKSCTGLCSSELTVFQSVLGQKVHVERQEHILLGARRCVYLCEEIA